MKNSLDTSWEEGMIKGKMEGKMEIAKKLILLGLDDEKISEVTELSIAEIKGLRNREPS